MLSALAHSMLRDHVRLWITFVFCSNTCVSLNITKTSPQHHATLSAFHAFAVHDLYSLYIARTCTIARMSPFSGQCERLSRRLVKSKSVFKIFPGKPFKELRGVGIITYSRQHPCSSILESL